MSTMTPFTFFIISLQCFCILYWCDSIFDYSLAKDYQITSLTSKHWSGFILEPVLWCNCRVHLEIWNDFHPCSNCVIALKKKKCTAKTPNISQYICLITLDHLIYDSQITKKVKLHWLIPPPPTHILVTSKQHIELIGWHFLQCCEFACVTF